MERHTVAPMTAPSSDEFEDRLFAILRSHPRGLSEHELFKHLADCGDRRFAAAVFHDPLALYRAHFILFHHLYLMQERLCSEDRGRLRITALCIRWSASGAPGETALDTADPLREYYLDIDNLRDTTAGDVQRMVGAFWSGLRQDERREQALATLELSDPVDAAQIKRAYRRLAMEHHPDRGGDTGRLQELNAAMEILTGRRRR